ncbi:hypothetical protein A2707_05315 [Candidatus Saccharibacteria bacterium RIFCSPHIGHO2_01_FULL_45_15]|nr:MAG: hypothetical protein A2707_05315 [Candidatus Saccharibacteria bacterium RIFCSPHIGHO2_01_FULL_45_15]OGL27404.1 MAG: hypothetical protein A3C39_05180 [Candidatus Saccharibacteria bacterium RIFCSPHIGHO2_02_FULL_46_12]OGL32619.1 MAG: hypothetical protein A3E76_04650 [Candidatus Saccharibacteria bacterium RIFCSPHIGHO2_12_FULL_44_22]
MIGNPNDSFLWKRFEDNHLALKRGISSVRSGFWGIFMLIFTRHKTCFCVLHCEENEIIEKQKE